METKNILIDEAKPNHTVGHRVKRSKIEEIISDLKYYLPAQAPLKDFIHHNTLHAFQHLKFNQAIRHAAEIFGYKVSLSITEYRAMFESKRIREDVLDYIICSEKGEKLSNEWKHKLLYTDYANPRLPRIGTFRANWKKIYKIDLDSLVHPTLFRLVCSYLDQGISMWNFPVWHRGFLSSVREIERQSFVSIFKTERARKLLVENHCSLQDLLDILVGDESLYKHYLFDQQFAHQGWSGMVSAIEDHPHTLLDHKKISLHDFMYVELLMEIDALTFQFGPRWQALNKVIPEKPKDLFGKVTVSESQEVLWLWQQAYEWSYYDEVLAHITNTPEPNPAKAETTFQAMFCLDDRECSIRRYVEKVDPHCETFGTPGFFNVEFFFKPIDGKFFTKLCPAPMNPKYLIKEVGEKGKRRKDPHFAKQTHTLFRGWLITQTLGFWSALKLFLTIFKPSVGPATTTSFSHMDKVAKLTIENGNTHQKENDLQVGFTIEEMSQRVEGLLNSIGLVKNFARVIYVIGHGSSSVNNPHYAAYDCGACSGRPGSVNARVLSFMANHSKVRAILLSRGIDIPDTTQFIGGLHDTTRDEITFYDEDSLTTENLQMHLSHLSTFTSALDLNAKERSRRFDSVDTKSDMATIHKKVKNRSVSLFQPRPELNHATNALCIVGRRALTKNLFLDRRAFLNSYDYRIDPDGKYLFNILKAAAPVCGGINLEYFFSRVDNQKMGAGTKLPHNVMGLFGVANGIEGDLRPGLPSQMIEVHDPVRLLMIVEHFPEVVLSTIQQHAETYEWFVNEWLHVVVVHPENRQLYHFKEGAFSTYQPITKQLHILADVESLVESHHENLPVYLIA